MDTIRAKISAILQDEQLRVKDICTMKVASGYNITITHYLGEYQFFATDDTELYALRQTIKTHHKSIRKLFL